jgi:transcriptional regulator GlxA family with amidase domain
MKTPTPRRIGLVIYPGYQILDLAALTVFECVNTITGRTAYQLEVVAESEGAVLSSVGVATQAKALGRRRFDTLLVGGSIDVPVPTPTLVEQLRRVAARTRRVASICTGTFVLAEAGVFDGRRVTTHWILAAELQRRHPQLDVEDDRIFVQDGPAWSSAGMTACLDMALAMVEQDLGAEVAKAVARMLVVYHRRVGGQSQFSALAELEPASNRIRRALDYAREHLDDDLSVEQLAGQANWSARHFTREFQAQTGHSPAKAIERLRLEAARELIESGHTSIASIARQSGFGDEERMRRAFIRTLGRPPQAVVREARGREALALT